MRLPPQQLFTRIFKPPNTRLKTFYRQMTSTTYTLPLPAPASAGQTIPLHLPPSQPDPSPLLSFAPFNHWLKSTLTSLQTQRTNAAHPFHTNPYSLHSVTLLSISFPRNDNTKPALFAYIDAEIATEDKSERLPGFVFLRGGSVAMLVVLKDEESGEEWVPLTVQPRLAIGTLEMTELPAGMLDGSGQFAGVAAKELKEECGLEVKEDELVDLGESVYGEREDDGLVKGMYPSPGGCDEAIRLFACFKSVKREEIKSLKGRLGGEREEGENITLRLVRLSELWKSTKDAKALSAWALLNGLRSEGKLI